MEALFAKITSSNITDQIIAAAIIYLISKALRLLKPSAKRALHWLFLQIKNGPVPKAVQKAYKSLRNYRASRLNRLRSLRRDPAETTRLQIRAATYLILFMLWIAFYVAIVIFLSFNKITLTHWYETHLLATPMYITEIFWLWYLFKAEELSKLRRKLFYKPKARKGDKAKAS